MQTQVFSPIEVDTEWVSVPFAMQTATDVRGSCTLQRLGQLDDPYDTAFESGEYAAQNSPQFDS